MKFGLSRLTGPLAQPPPSMPTTVATEWWQLPLRSSFVNFDGKTLETRPPKSA